MPKIQSRDFAIAFDVCGCPNRCRHCWLGCDRNGKISIGDARWAVDRFRAYTRKGEEKPFIDKLAVSLSFREPGFSNDYEKIYEIESELSDAKPYRFELLSIWRLGRDEEYAQWARGIGTGKCQITFFGMEETNDWFFSGIIVCSPVPCTRVARR